MLARELEQCYVVLAELNNDREQHSTTAMSPFREAT